MHIFGNNGQSLQKIGISCQKRKLLLLVGPHQDLGEVAVSVLLSILSLQVLLLYQDVDAFLDHGNLGLEPEL